MSDKTKRALQRQNGEILSLNLKISELETTLGRAYNDLAHVAKENEEIRKELERFVEAEQLLESKNQELFNQLNMALEKIRELEPPVVTEAMSEEMIRREE